MAVQEKYGRLVQAAQQAGVRNLAVREQNNVLYIDGEAPNGQVKDQLWQIYNEIDPDFRAGDLVLDVNVGASAAGSRAKVTTQESNLNIRKGPGTDQQVVGKAAHNDYVTLISKANEQWWLVRTSNGVEGYASAQYLSPE
ncbi:SH3 domain-containing protein [Flaviaesturariibacter aridisoli]|uniref:SH3 domain-containing protein n=1 Tax=Flaviaesturariibacter aridisoli TaxID=2545761 RepID=A0A4R4DV02_9BACT|nr:SH3 domain-containing protein [Flaviaesturariibacter aridisoli]TCZ64136.1 SH3 domain-containing protein [Flaviaesturariibacter aridisoli]TCZ68069.1 SH3 domain-containing protein [Flaviaesturariibacter aridisoli]